MFNIKLFVKICQVLGSTCLHENFYQANQQTMVPNDLQWSILQYDQ